MEPTEENKHIVLRQIEALNAGDAAASAGLVHPDFYDHDTSGWPAGCRLEPLDIVAEDDRVAVRARVRAGGVTSDQMHIWRLVGGRIVEHWGCFAPGNPEGGHR